MKLSEPEIVKTQAPKHLLGINRVCNLIKNDTAALWQSFMPCVKNIQNRKGTKLYAVDCYGKNFSIATFNPNLHFTKWACVEVYEPLINSERFENLRIEPSLFAVFSYIGLAKDASKAFEYIYQDWANESKFSIDFSKPIVCEMESNYNPNNATETEFIWIPIQPK